jgi:hypothetical protein
MFSNRSKVWGFCLVLLSAAFFVSCGGGGSSGGGGGGGGNTSAWLIKEKDVVDTGNGVDGIPALSNPVFELATTITSVDPDDFVVVLRYEGEVRVYPHDILDYHEIVNDGTASDPFVMSYCPLTGSAVAWKGNATHADKTFGVSGLLYDSNLILFDRETGSYWSQMLQLAVNGARIGERPETMQVIEMKFSTLLAAYPNALVMTRDTGHVRPYDESPYQAYTNSGSLAFEVSHWDTRLFPKARIVGIHDNDSSKVYQIPAMGTTMRTINDQFANQSIVVVGNSTLNFTVIYDRRLADGTILSFNPVQDDLPIIMSDTEGNTWDMFGTAVTGPRVGAQLAQTRSYKAMWFAWGSFFRNAEIYFN